MTVRDWIATRTPAPPPALAGRIAASLGARADDGRTAPYEACLESAIELLSDLLVPESLGRDAAADLLAADALVTYAFEAAADDVARLDARAAAAMVQLASLAPRAE